eukprot:1158688-Pelagomonas_calceolata.AAC.3
MASLALFTNLQDPLHPNPPTCHLALSGLACRSHACLASHAGVFGTVKKYVLCTFVTRVPQKPHVQSGGACKARQSLGKSAHASPYCSCSGIAPGGAQCCCLTRGVAAVISKVEVWPYDGHETLQRGGHGPSSKPFGAGLQP